MQEEAPVGKRVPVTIITGFLGSGKTTFLNYILTAHHGKRIAVIQNEFGQELGLERAMLVGKDGDRVGEWLELPNGCICCTTKGDLAATLEKLAERKDSYDYIFVETTGLADPGPLANQLWLDTGLEASIYLDAILTIIDAKHFGAALDEQKPDGSINEAQRQVAYADVIIVNKTDLVSEMELQKLQDKIDAINAMAPRVLAQRSQAPIDKVIDIHAFDVDRFEATAAKHEHDHNHDHDHGCDHEHPEECTSHGHQHRRPILEHDPSFHTSTIKTVSLHIPGNVDLEKTHSWLASLLWEQHLTMFRMKGQLSVAGTSERYILQGVHDNFEVQASGFSWEESLPQPTNRTDAVQHPRTNSLVFIGKQLDPEALRASFIEHCLVIE